MPSTKKLTQNDFINRLLLIYGEELDFSPSVYKNTRTNVQVICRKHGSFESNARRLLGGVGCPLCKKKWERYVTRRRMSQDLWVKKATELHNGFYDYTQVNYINSRTSVKIICPIHGDFYQLAGGHLEGYGCRMCANKKHGDYRPWYIATYFDRFPEKKSIPATLYLIYCELEDFYKVGITTKKDVSDRIKYMKYDFEIVETIEDTMYNVALAEQKILKESVRYKPKRRFGGWSECFKHYVNIRDYISPNGAGKPTQEDPQT